MLEDFLHSKTESMVPHLYCPVNLDIDAVVAKFPFPLREGLKKDYLRFIVHSVITRRASLSDEHLKRLGKDNGFVPLNSIILKEKIPQYQIHLDYLEQADIIQCDNTYIVGKVSKGYKLTDLYLGQPVILVPVADFILRQKIIRDDPFKKSNKAFIEFPYLSKWFRTKMLTIDEHAAIKYINKLEIVEFNNIDSNRLFSKQRKLEEKASIFEKYKNFKVLVSRFANQDFFFKIDDAGNRLHTNLTNLPKGLRKHVTYEGKKLVSIDIVNSQPYMSIGLLQKEFWQTHTNTEKPTLKEIHKGKYKETRKERKIINSIIMFLDSPESLYSRGFEKENFIKNVINGDFYEFLITVFENELGLKLGGTQEEKRRKVKGKVLTLLFDNDNKGYNQEPDSPSQLFRKKFPMISRIFRYIKKNDYRMLAIILQRIESSLLLGKVCKRISKESPDIPLFTIHDSIVTTKGNESYIESVMKNELEKSLGNSPTLKIEDW